MKWLYPKTVCGKEYLQLSGKEIKIRENYQFIDANTQALETFMIINGEEFKSMEIKLTRK